MSEIFPFRLAPYFRTRIWGFHDLAPWFDYKTDGEPIGEVWLTGEMCKAATGPFVGQTLRAITDAHGPELLGSALGDGEFPLRAIPALHSGQTGRPVQAEGPDQPRVGGVEGRSRI